MISRYALYDTAEIDKQFNLAKGLPKGVKPHYNHSPTATAPVIVNNKGDRVVKLMKWGLVAIGAKDTNSVFRYKTHNIPSEKIFSKHSWERAVRERRCLVPANGYYDLSINGEKRALYAQSNDKSLLAFAGVYNTWQDPEGIAHGTYSIITTEAAHDVSHFSDRMPVIIKREDQTRWLDPTTSDFSSIHEMLRSHPSDSTTIHEVSPAVHSPKLNQSSLINRI